MEENLNPAPVPQAPVYQDDEFEIDWMGIFTRLLKHWKQIILIGFIFSCIGVASALTMKRKYNVTMTLAPELQSRNSSNLSNMAACWAWAASP